MRKLKHTFKSDILFKLTFVKYKHLLKRLVAAVLNVAVVAIEEFVILNSEIVPKAILISFIDFELFDCKEYCSEFVCMEKYRHEMLTDKMSIFVFELGKLPVEIDRGNILELFLRLFKAETEEELEMLEGLEVYEMTQMLNAYHDIVNSPDYAYLERRRLMDAMDENQAINNAERRGEARERAKWESERAKWENEHAKWESEHAQWESERAVMQEELAKLRAQAWGK